MQLANIRTGFQENIRARIDQVGIFRFAAEHVIAFAAAFFIPTLIVWAGIYLYTL